MNVDAIVKVDTTISWCFIDGSAYLINEKDGSIMKLENTAAKIWSYLAVEGNVDRAAILTAKEYNVDSEIVKADVYRFVTSMKERGYLVCA